jgi:hypothetical protein
VNLRQNHKQFGAVEHDTTDNVLSKACGHKDAKKYREMTLAATKNAPSGVHQSQ